MGQKILNNFTNIVAGKFSVPEIGSGKGTGSGAGGGGPRGSTGSGGGKGYTPANGKTFPKADPVK